MAIDVKYDLREITTDVTQWCDEVYPTRTRDHMIAKLQEEFGELAERPLDAWEMADIFIIMLDLSQELGFDIAKVIAHKMDINKNQRQWQVGQDGILKHVKTSGHTAGGNDQAVAYRQRSEGADPGRTPIQRGDIDPRAVEAMWPCSRCRAPTSSLGSCARCRGVQDRRHTDTGQETATAGAGKEPGRGSGEI